MRAARIHAYGPPASIVLENLDAPKPGAGAVTVRVSAAGVGNWDALIRSGRSGLALSLPLTLGAEVAGVIESVPATSAAHMIPGDAVYGSTNSLFIGGYAQYATCSADMLARKPRQLSPVEAASLPVAAVTAWQMVIEHARLAAGQTVVVHGAAGNVGALATQIARSRGARVIGTIHREDDAKELRALGVTELLRNEADFARLARAADVVIDTVGGRSQTSLVPLVKPAGILVSSVSQPDAALAASAQIRTDYFIARVSTAVLGEISKLVEAGAVQTRIGVQMPLDEVRLAHQMLDGVLRRPRGKIVLTLD